MTNEIYFDHAATTPLDPRVRAAIEPYLDVVYGNPSSVYRLARTARAALDTARDKVAEVLGARSAEIVFTSGGTESDNAAIKGVAFSRPGSHIITTQIEHHAVLHSAQFIERLGYAVTYLPVDRHGTVDPEDVARAIRPETSLISVMHANNEIGTIQPIGEIARIARARKVLLHVDAVQSAGALNVDVDALGVDLLSISGHKLYGPKGSGLLYVRRGTVCWPFLHGGGQERGRRAGTENLAAIVGLAEALQLAQRERSERNGIARSLRDALIRGVRQVWPAAQLTGHPEHRLPNHASFVLPGVDGESLLLALDQRGIMASSGSACTSGSLEPSHVLLALGLPTDLCRGSLRLTVGHHNVAADVEQFLAVLPEVRDRVTGLVTESRLD